MADSSREARRRRIVDGGSDRLALITGRIQGLPAPSSPAYHEHSQTESFPQFFSQDQVPDKIYVGLEDKHDASGSTLLKNDIRKKEYDAGSQVKPQISKHEITREATRTPAEEHGNKTQPFSATQKTSTITETLPKPHGHRPKFFTAKQISNGIMASERTRSFCSLMIALLVVLSYIDNPFLDLVNTESVIASRPLYILLLTDVTIVLARLFIEKQRGFDKHAEEERMVPPQDDGHNWTGAVMVLETGLVVYQTICAIFMDFCIYAVIVICGLSLV